MDHNPSSTFKITDKPVAHAPLNPEHIMQVGLGFWASKTLLTAIKLKLFTALAEKPALTANQIREKLKLHERSYLDFLDALVSLNFLKREGNGKEAQYSNTMDTDVFLDKKKPTYLGGILEMADNRLYKFWGNLEEGLKTGNPQNEVKNDPSKSLFTELYSDKAKMKEFMIAMSGIQIGAFMSFAAQFDFSKYKTVVDAGGSIGALSIQIARQHPGIKCISFDLPQVAEVAKSYVQEQGLSKQIEIASGNFFENIPKADVVTMGNILHDWSDDDKLKLITKAYDALPKGGAFVCIENMIDDDRRKNTFGLLMSLNMLIETKEGRDFTYSEFVQWTNKVGFKDQSFLPLAGPTAAAIAYK